MHELSLAERLLEIIEDAARADGFSRVSKVIVEIGQLAVVEPEAMRFCFDAVVQGSLADGAQLEIVEVPGSGWCATCAATVPMPELIAVCPRCGAYPLQANGGKELKLRTLEVD
jgi:hydrogenase nickel incorporation protein HypA/HybF